MKLKLFPVDICMPCYWPGVGQDIQSLSVPVYRHMLEEDVRQALVDEVWSLENDVDMHDALIDAVNEMYNFESKEPLFGHLPRGDGFQDETQYLYVIFREVPGDNPEQLRRAAMQKENYRD